MNQIFIDILKHLAAGKMLAGMTFETSLIGRVGYVWNADRTDVIGSISPEHQDRANNYGLEIVAADFKRGVYVVRLLTDPMSMDNLKIWQENLRLQSIKDLNKRYALQNSANPKVNEPG